jgi:hypothetical protein
LKRVLRNNYGTPNIKKEAPALQKQYLGLELEENPVTKAQLEALASIRAQWR